jgi:hypothetical protein
MAVPLGELVEVLPGTEQAIPDDLSAPSAARFLRAFSDSWSRGSILRACSYMSSASCTSPAA